jgi:hypothetical protein
LNEVHFGNEESGWNENTNRKNSVDVCGTRGGSDDRAG